MSGVPDFGVRYRSRLSALLASPTVTPAEALADLTEISSQVEAAVLVHDGTVLASTLPAASAEQLARAARELLEGAERVRPAADEVAHVQAATREGSVFVVRQGERVIVATTAASPTAGLMLYDLKTCLRALGDGGEASDGA